jgi:hypothetical protein
MRPTVPDEATRRRRVRYRSHHWLRTRSSRAGAAICLTAAEGTGAVRLSRSTAGNVHVTGTRRCGSPWACPVCAPKIAERRALEIEQAVANALARGLEVYLCTATVSHHLGDELADVYGLVADAWRATFSGRAAATLRASGYLGQIRAVEVTHGVNGWHPHVHALIITAPGSSSLASSLGARFAEQVHALGGVCTVPGPGWDVSPVSAAEQVSGYVAKVEGGWGAGLEVARADVKLSRSGAGRTPFQLLDAATHGDLDAERLWRCYEGVTAGRARIRWSQGLRELLRVEVVTDDEAATADSDDATDAEWLIPSDVWDALVRAGVVVVIIEAAQAAAAGALLSVEGVVVGSPP